MKALRISDAETMILALQDEIRRNEQSRYDHRLHGVLLVAHGMTCPKVAELLGDSTRSVESWAKAFERRGLCALVEKAGRGRKARLNQDQLKIIDQALRETPQAMGLEGNLWDGKTLSAFIKQSFDIELKVRQCQRLFRQLEFRLRKPRPQVAKADPERHAAHKKTPRNGS
jgi:transposase